MKTNTGKYAINEVAILLKTVKEPLIEPFIPEILALVDRFGDSGQSGGSAPFVANAISRAVKSLCLKEPLCGITGVEMEWAEVDGGWFQNKRCSAILKEGADADPYYLDAIIWKDANGEGTNGCAFVEPGEELASRQFIKSFPFTPKTFYIDVVYREVNGERQRWVKNENQLKAVFKYYR